MYHGGIREGEGIEQLIRATEKLDFVYFVLFGYMNSNSPYLELIQKSPARDRIRHHEAVPQKDLWKYVAAADLEVALLENYDRSYYYALPNKLMESIQAGTPVLGSTNPEIRNVIERYQVGLTCDPSNLSAVCDCIEKIHSDSALYSGFRENCKKAKPVLCWEKESFKLKESFQKLM